MRYPISVVMSMYVSKSVRCDVNEWLHQSPLHPSIDLIIMCVCWVYSLIVVICCCWRLQLLFVSSKNRFICSAWLYPDSCLVDRFFLFLSRFLSDCMRWLTTDTIENVWESSTIFIAPCYETQYYNSYIILVGFLLTASYGLIHTFLSWCTLGKMQKKNTNPFPRLHCCNRHHYHHHHHDCRHCRCRSRHLNSRFNSIH